jgi:hypothetical protein
MLIVRYLFNHPEAWILLILLLLWGARLRFRSWRNEAFWLPTVVLGLAMVCIYGIVNIEERYVTLAYLVIVLSIFAMLRAPHTGVHADSRNEAQGWLRKGATAMIVLLAFLATGESLRAALEARRHEFALPHPWYDAQNFGAARGLDALGVRPGDEVACMGAVACLTQYYWARLAGVRILTEVYNPNPQLFEQYAGLPNRAQVLATLKAQGAKVLVAQFDPGALRADPAAAAGWVRLGDTVFYALPLNLQEQPGLATTSGAPATLPWKTTREGGP